MAAVDLVVVGGGIAGVSALAAVAGEGEVLLLERERSLFAHASGRNAAIYRPLELDQTSAWLARRSAQLLAELGDGEPWLRSSGLVLAAASAQSLAALLAHGRSQGVRCELLEGKALCECAPTLGGGEVQAGVFVNDGGVLDAHAMLGMLERAARTRGARVRTGAGVARLLCARGRVEGVQLDDGTRIACGAVALAAGAWAAELGARSGAALRLTPYLRHLVLLEPDTALPASHPVVWRLDHEIYYRPELGCALASPCDAADAPPGLPVADPAALETLARKLARTAPCLAHARVRRSWACLRTFAEDRELVVGEDPRLSGLLWFTGLGGRGMSVAPAAGEVLRASLRREPHPMSAALTPGRLALI